MGQGVHQLGAVSVDSILSQAYEANGSMSDPLVRGLEAVGVVDFASGEETSGASTQAAFSELGSDALYEYCFAAGTLVLMADGSRKPIEQIQPGEMVLSVSDCAMASVVAGSPLSLGEGWREGVSESAINEGAESTQQSVALLTPSIPAPEPRRVVQVYHNAPARLLKLHIRNDVIRTTSGHPFYAQDRGWTRAEHLAPGDRFYSHTGEWLELADIQVTEDVEPVYNLQVEDHHTYFVLLRDGTESLLVHNVSYKFPNGYPGGDKELTFSGTELPFPAPEETPTDLSSGEDFVRDVLVGAGESLGKYWAEMSTFDLYQARQIKKAPQERFANQATTAEGVSVQIDLVRDWEPSERLTPEEVDFVQGMLFMPLKIVETKLYAGLVYGVARLGGTALGQAAGRAIGTVSNAVGRRLTSLSESLGKQLSGFSKTSGTRSGTQGGAGLVGDAAKGVAPAKRLSNQTVLGHYPDYVKLSDKLGARRFDIPTDTWNKMTPTQQWAANRKFLDRLVSKGDEIILANPANSARPGSFFARELEYLKNLGYRVSDDGLRMIPGG